MADNTAAAVQAPQSGKEHEVDAGQINPELEARHKKCLEALVAMFLKQELGIQYGTSFLIRNEVIEANREVLKETLHCSDNAIDYFKALPAWVGEINIVG